MTSQRYVIRRNDGMYKLRFGEWTENLAEADLRMDANYLFEGAEAIPVSVTIRIQPALASVGTEGPGLLDAVQALLYDIRPLVPGEPLDRMIPAQHAVKTIRQAQAARNTALGEGEKP